MISQAFAQGNSAFGGLESLTSFLPLILIFVVFYFFLIRPQQKKAQEHRQMVGNLRRGDRVVTNGGLIGTVIRVVDDREIEVEIAKGVQVHIVRGMVADVTAKTQPVASNDGSAKSNSASPGKNSEVSSKPSLSKAPAASEEVKKKTSKPAAAKTPSKGASPKK